MSSPLATDSLADQAMEERSNANAIRMPRVWPRGGLSLRLQPPSLDWLSIALVLLLAITWLSEGGAALAGISPRWAGRVVQLGETAIVIWLALRLGRERRFRWLVPLVIYGAWVAIGLINSHAPLGDQTTALRSWLLAPVLAVLLAFEGSSEARARAVILALFALTAFEFILTIVQLFVIPYASRDADLIVGSFGTDQGGVLGVVILLLACVASAAYLINARGGKQALAVSLIFALVSGWAVIKYATILLPVVFVVTALAALLLKQVDRRRALIGIMAALLSSAAVVGSYAIFKPGSLTALNPAGGLESYVTYGSTAGGLTRAQVGDIVVADYWNAVIASSALPAATGVPRAHGFRISSITGGDYTAEVSSPGAVAWPVQPGRSYLFSIGILNGAHVAQSVVPEIEWLSARSGRLSDSAGNHAGLTNGQGRVVHAGGLAPPGASFAIPKIAVVGKPPPGASSYVWSPQFKLTTQPVVAGPSDLPRQQSASVRPPILYASPSASQNGGGPPVVGLLPGHLDLLTTAIRGLSGSVTREMFGFGLGSARFEGHSVDSAHLTPQEAGDLSDLGTLLTERGWSGVAVVAVLAVILVLLALRLTARSPGVGGWVTAFRLAVPGAIVALAAYAFIGDYFKTYASALTFWIVLGLGLATRVKPAAVPSGRASSRSRTIAFASHLRMRSSRAEGRPPRPDDKLGRIVRRVVGLVVIIVLVGTFVVLKTNTSGSNHPGSRSGIFASYSNAIVRSATLPNSGAAGFRIGNAAPGNYTALMLASGDKHFHILANLPYVYSVYVEGGASAHQTITVQIEWMSAKGAVLGTSFGYPSNRTSTVLSGPGAQFQRLVVYGESPPNAATALPKIVVTGTPPPDATILATAPEFRVATAGLRSPHPRSSASATRGARHSYRYDPFGIWPDSAPMTGPSFPIRCVPHGKACVGSDRQGIPVVSYGGTVGMQYNPYSTAASGLQWYSSFLYTRERKQFSQAIRDANWLLRHQEPDGRWLYHFPDASYLIKPPWVSAIAQGAAISLLVRIWRRTGDPRYLNAAKRALLPFSRPEASGGVLSFWGKNWFYQEAPNPAYPSFILNGFTYALIGLYDLSVAAPHSDAVTLYKRGLNSLVAMLPLYDDGVDKSTYDLGYLTMGTSKGPTTASYIYVENVALKALISVTRNPILQYYLDRWSRPAAAGR